MQMCASFTKIAFSVTMDKKTTSALFRFYSHHQELDDRYDVSVVKFTSDMFPPHGDQIYSKTIIGIN